MSSANHIFAFLGFAFQFVILAAVLGTVGWQVRKFLARRAESRQLERARKVAAMVAASKRRVARSAA